MSNALWNAIRWCTLPVRRRRALRLVLAMARQPLDPGNDDGMMAFWAVLSRTGLRDRQGELLDAGRRFVRRVERDPERRAAWSHMRVRLDTLESSLDAHAHFEHLTGHRLGHELNRRRPGRNARPRHAPNRRVTPGRAFAAVVTAWVVLFVATNLNVSNPFQFEPVGLSGYAWEQVGERTRGDETAATLEKTVSYAAALAHARSARQTWLGLFPSYDTETLMEARTMMERAIMQAEGGYSVPAQAYETLDIIDGLIAERSR